MEWLESVLMNNNLAKTGEPRIVRLRPWSEVTEIPTSQGNLYFKRQTSQLANEAKLLPFIASRFPESLPEIIASDSELGLTLLRDAGVSLRSVLQTAPDIAHWQRLIRLHSQIQREFVSRTDELIRHGALDRRLSVLPTLYESLLPFAETLRPQDCEALSADENRKLHEMSAPFQEMCEALLKTGLPETVNHDDLHDGNVFVRDGVYRIIDWGDCSAAFVFFTLPVTLGSVADSMSLADDSPEILSLRETALSYWEDFAPMPDLQAAYELAAKANCINRALTWRQAIANVPDSYCNEHTESLLHWLRKFLSQTWRKKENFLLG